MHIVYEPEFFHTNDRARFEQLLCGAFRQKAKKAGHRQGRSKKLQYLDVSIAFPNLGDSSRWYFQVMSAAAFANLSAGVSSGAGYIVFLVGEQYICIPMSWKP